MINSVINHTCTSSPPQRSGWPHPQLLSSKRCFPISGYFPNLEESDGNYKQHITELKGGWTKPILTYLSSQTLLWSFIAAFRSFLHSSWIATIPYPDHAMVCCKLLAMECSHSIQTICSSIVQRAHCHYPSARESNPQKLQPIVDITPCRTHGSSRCHPGLPEVGDNVWNSGQLLQSSFSSDNSSSASAVGSHW